MSSREAFIQQCLKRHNFHRANHAVGPLTLNRDLCSLAQGWAERLASKSGLEHNDNAYHKGEKAGENIAWSSNMSPNGESMVDQWYNEVKHYNFRKPDFSLNTGHFTQLVWKDSKEVGFGLAVKGGECFLVANYHPSGNYLGNFEKNVFPCGSTPNVSGGASASGSDKPKKSLFGDFFSKRVDSSSEWPGHEPKQNDFNNNSMLPKRFNNNFIDESIDNTGNNTSTTTTVETKIVNGIKTTKTTVVTKSATGTQTKISTKQESL